jgi:hypothetical protein
MDDRALGRSERTLSLAFAGDLLELFARGKQPGTFRGTARQKEFGQLRTEF